MFPSHALRPRPGQRCRPRSQLRVEDLEDRSLLSASPLPEVLSTAAVFTMLQPSQEVESSGGDVEASLNLSAEQIGLTTLRSTLLFSGVNGDGINGNRIGVAILDTGIDRGHPFVGTRYAGGYDFVNGDAFPDDDNGHGTHVAGIIASQHATFKGVAPGVNLYALKVLDAAGSGSWANMAAGLDWVITNAADNNIRVVNLSLGDGANHGADQGNYWIEFFYGIHDRINTLEGMGVTVVAAAGNAYFTFQTAGSSYPGSVSTLDVGAVWTDDSFGKTTWSSGAIDNSTDVDRVVSFSQRDPAHGRFIMAPGAKIYSTIPTTLDIKDGLRDGFTAYSGTSMATPHIAGVVALIQDAAVQFGPGYFAPNDVVNIIRNTADIIFDGDDEDDNVSNTNSSFRRVDAYSAVEYVYNLYTPPTPRKDLAVTAVATSASASVGDQVSVNVSLKNEGTSTETFTVELWSNNASTDVTTDDILIASWEETLTAGASVSRSRAWNTAGAAVGTHQLLARHLVADDDPSDNSATTSIILNAPPPPAADRFYFSLQNDGSVGGIAVANEDIVAFDGTNFRILFDGSNVGLRGDLGGGGFTIDGFDMLSPTEFLFSFAEKGWIEPPGASNLEVDDCDVVKFTATSLGPNNTVGTFQMFFDGNNATKKPGLSSNPLSTDSAEGIDAIELLPDGRLLVSTKGNFKVPHELGGDLSGTDEDLIAYNFATNKWSMYFDGSDVGLGESGEDIDGVAVVGNKLHLSTNAGFAVPGFSGADEDVFVFTATTLGGNTTGTYQVGDNLFFDGSLHGLAGNDLGALEVPIIRTTSLFVPEVPEEDETGFLPESPSPTAASPSADTFRSAESVAPRDISWAFHLVSPASGGVSFMAQQIRSQAITARDALFSHSVLAREQGISGTILSGFASAAEQAEQSREADPFLTKPEVSEEVQQTGRNEGALLAPLPGLWWLPDQPSTEAQEAERSAVVDEEFAQPLCVDGETATLALTTVLAGFVGAHLVQSRQRPLSRWQSAGTFLAPVRRQ